MGVGLLLLMLPGALASRAPLLRPAPSARLYAGSLVLGLTTLLAGLALHAGPVLATVIGGETALAGTGLIAHLSPGGLPAALTSAALATLLAGGLGRRLAGLRRRRQQARADPRLGVHHRQAHHDLVILPTSAPLAYSIEGNPAQVIVSEELVYTLSPPELSILVDHERAHLRYHHQRYLAVAAIVEQVVGLLPLAGRGALALRLAIERWADDEAAGSDLGTRALLSRALLHVAPQEEQRPRSRLDGLVVRSVALTHRPIARRDGVEIVALGVVLILLATGTATLGHWLGDVPALIADLGA